MDRFFESKHVWLPHTKLSAKIDDHPPNLHTHLRVKKSDMLDLIDRSNNAEEDNATLDATAALTSTTMVQKGGKKNSKQEKEEKVLYF